MAPAMNTSRSSSGIIHPALAIWCRHRERVVIATWTRPPVHVHAGHFELSHRHRDL